MSVKKEASGRRSVQVETEVPGTPEEVWQAIATGPGISSWFVPTAFEERDGTPVAVTSNLARAWCPVLPSRRGIRRGCLPRRARAGLLRRPSQPSGASERARVVCASRPCGA